jgi:hypothetical protein
MALWESGDFKGRLLSIPIVDLKAITDEKLDNMTRDIGSSMENQKDQGQICDWLLSNVILKNPALSKHVSRWMDETSIIRQRCIALGEKTGLYIDFPVSKGCTSPYLPIWINSVVGKRKN